jgi:hypothetical protein
LEKNSVHTDSRNLKNNIYYATLVDTSSEMTAGDFNNLKHQTPYFNSNLTIDPAGSNFIRVPAGHSLTNVQSSQNQLHFYNNYTSQDRVKTAGAINSR